MRSCVWEGLQRRSALRVPALQMCGCDACQETLRLHGLLNRLIASQDKTVEAVQVLSDSLSRIEALA